MGNEFLIVRVSGIDVVITLALAQVVLAEIQMEHDTLFGIFLGVEFETGQQEMMVVIGWLNHDVGNEHV